MREADNMTDYLVLYRIDSIMSPRDLPFGFRCSATDPDHAEEQCANAYPDAELVWVSNAGTMSQAWDEYFNA